MGTGAFYDAEQDYAFGPGEAWFFPANLQTVSLQPKGTCSVLRVTVPEINTLRRELLNQGFDETAISRVVLGAGT